MSSTNKPYDVGKIIQDFEGGAVGLASKIGISRIAVYNWQKCGVPARRCGQVSDLTGIPIEKLRPDIFRVGRRKTKKRTTAASK